MSEKVTLESIFTDPDERSPLVECAWNYMPEGMRYTVTTAPTIPAIVAKAKKIAAEYPDFIRCDQGQIVDVMPDKEIYYGPSAGIDELRELLAKFWGQVYKIPTPGLTKNNVAIVSGATEGLAIVLRMFAYQQNVGLMHFYWGNYKGIILNSGGTPIRLSFFDKDYNFDLTEAEKTIQRENITSLVINFPINPSGDVLYNEELEALADMARRLNLIIIADEVYNILRYKGEPQTMLSYAPERTVVVSSASKEYLIPGARTGYVIAAHERFINEWVLRLIRSSSSSANVLGQKLLIDILRSELNDIDKNRPPQIITKIKTELVKRRDLMISVLAKRGMVLAGRDKDFPAGAISILAALPIGLEVDDKTFVERGLDMKKFSVIPGSIFGAPGCLRFGYAGMTPETIQRLGESLDDVISDISSRRKMSEL